MFVSDQTILIAAHKFSGAQEIMARIRFGYESMPDYIRAGVTEYNKQSMIFDNGSRIMAQTTTETTSRGMSLSILYSDELAYVRNTIAREFWTSCSMTLSTGGKAIVTSTPSSNEDLFSELWHNANKTIDEFGNSIPGGVGVNGFKAFTASWREHPDRDDAWAATQEELIGTERFKREICCEFIIDEETLINPFKLNQMHGVEPIELQGQVRWYSKPNKDSIYIVALDPSLGTGGNQSAIQIVDAKTQKQVAEWCHNKTTIEKQVDLLKQITAYLVEVTENVESVYWSIENNTIGEATLVTIRNIGEENIPGIFLTEPARLGNVKKFRKGFNTTNTSKLTACAKLKQLIESDKMSIYSKKLISELKTFVSIGNTYQAQIGSNDDLVMSMILVIRMMAMLRDYIPELNESQDTGENSVPLPFIMSTYNTYV